jgi:perosamine synthetase
MSSIPLAVPEIGGNEWAYVKDCLDSGWVSSVGSYVDRFEREMATRTDNAHGVAVVNGTAALHLALLVVGLEPDDEVLVSALTFIAPANAIRYAGAWPVFIDAEPAFWQMDPQKVIDFCERECRWQAGVLRNKMTGRRIRAILPVHILGHPVDMEPLVELARKYGLAVVEDATEGLGAHYGERPIGHLGDIGCFSFNGNKVITAGGGGMLVTDSEEWAIRAKHLSTQAKLPGGEYIHDEVGFNYRLTNIQAAVGCAQLERLDEYIAAKRAIANRYAEAFADLPGIAVAPEAAWASSIFWLYAVLVDEGECGFDSRGLRGKLADVGIESRPLWQPLHLSPAYRGAPATDCSVAETLYRDGLCLPCSVGLQEDQEVVIKAVSDICRGQG